MRVMSTAGKRNPEPRRVYTASPKEALLWEVLRRKEDRWMDGVERRLEDRPLTKPSPHHDYEGREGNPETRYVLKVLTHDQALVKTRSLITSDWYELRKAAKRLANEAYEEGYPTAYVKVYPQGQEKSSMIVYPSEHTRSGLKLNPASGDSDFTSMLVVKGRGWRQESYDSESGDARRRAAQLRRLGYQATASSLGSQVTPLGRMRMSIVTIRPGRTGDEYLENVPEVREVRWNPRHDTEDRRAHALALSIMDYLIRHGWFSVKMENGNTYSVRLHSEGDLAAWVQSPDGSRVGPEVILDGPSDLQDSYHYALHHGTLEGWGPWSEGYKENPWGRRKNPSFTERLGRDIAVAVGNLKVGEGRTFETPHGKIHVKRVQSRQYHLHNVLGPEIPYGKMHERHRWGTESQILDDINHYLDTGYFPRDKTAWNPHEPPGDTLSELSESENLAAPLYEEFHGRPSTEEVLVSEVVHEPSDLAALGELVEVVVLTPVGKRAVIDFSSDPPLLCASADAQQLYIRGGDQSLDLDELKMPEEMQKRNTLVGVVEKLVYRTEKGFDGFKTLEYEHKLGEETGDAPVLNYDSESRLLSISGGAYTIEDRGIVN